MTVGSDIPALVAAMRNNPAGIRFADALAVAEHYFGAYTVKGSHHKFKTPWAEGPRVNLQRDGAKAKAYQVRQLLSAIDHIKESEQ